MLAAGRTYGQGLARSTLSASRCSRIIAPRPGGSALSWAASVYPVSAQVARHSGGGAPPDDRPPTTAGEEQNTPWSKYQRSMHQRTGLQGLENRRRRRRLSLVSPATVAGTARPKASTEKTNGFEFDVGATPRSPTARTATPALDEPSHAASPHPPSAEPVIPRSPWEERSGGSSAGGGAGEFEAVAEMERRSGKRLEMGGGTAHSGCSREAALKAELERKFGKDSDREPDPAPEGRHGQGGPSRWEASSELGTGDDDDGADGGAESDRKTAERSQGQSKRYQAAEKTGKKRRRGGRRGRGKGSLQGGAGEDGATSDARESESESRRDLAGEGGAGMPASESDIEVVVGNAASGGGGRGPAPRKRERSRTRGSGGKNAAAAAGVAAAAAAEGEKGGSASKSLNLSHYQRQGSAWNNVHAKKNLKRLLAGLRSDYGVREMLGAHDVPEKTLSKLLPMFQDLVLNDPDTAFDGKGRQKTQKNISDLCYHESFAADAVLMRKPIRGKSSSGRTFEFPSASTGGKRGKKRGETGFVKQRNDLVKHQFIPRLASLAQQKFPEEIEIAKRMNAIVDLRNPHHAYPLARLRKRRIIYHGGPTNSGKTYQAIERLKKAGANQQPGDGPAGLFCGPLRLLALEVYEQLNSQGVYCNLMTGQEKREVPFATHVSCTIEMASTENEYEVAVIDEIQMLADEQRGPSWTAAILGLNCPEIHVCGGMEGAVLVEAMAKEMGDDFELKEYQRKTELVCAEDSLGSSYKNVQSGDAVVAFSRKDIFNIKREIESKTPHKCCVIFGSLPQETRAHQARLFNTEDTGYDVLVASDAIGMGLNLNIRRVVFHAVAKRGVGGGRTAVQLPPTVLKQIGGRAGRHGKQWDFGEVTCLRASDMPYMHQVMNTPLESIPKAAIFPSVQRMQEFSNCLDETEPEDQDRRRLAETYAAFAQKAKVGDRYFLGTHDQYQTLANTLHPIENLTLKERYAISMAPVNGRNALLVRAIFLFASAHAAGLPVFINMQLPQKGVIPRSMSEFQTLCSKHNVLDLYRWMGVRFPSIECFAEKSVADIQRLELESIINEALRRKIAVAGPDSISAPEHDTFDKQVIRALKDPNGGAFSVTGGREKDVEDEDDDGLEYQQ